MKHPLARLDGIALLLTLMEAAGDTCPECGHGTQATSKNWARCKQCGTRVRRRSMEDVAKELKADMGGDK